MCATQELAIIGGGKGGLQYGILLRRQQKILLRSSQRQYTFPLACRASLLVSNNYVVERGREEWVVGVAAHGPGRM